MQVLSLHNCAKMSTAGLAALGRSCPQLRMLMLGGCVLAPTFPLAAGRSRNGADDSGAGADAAAAGPLRVIGVVEEGYYFPGGGSGSESAQSGLQMLREAVENGGVSRGLSGAARSGAVAALCGVAAALPCLRVLELTHFAPTVVDDVTEALSAAMGARSCADRLSIFDVECPLCHRPCNW